MGRLCKKVQKQACQIEDTCIRLSSLAADKDFDLQNTAVIMLSQELDGQIVTFEKTKCLPKQ